MTRLPLRRIFPFALVLLATAAGSYRVGQLAAQRATSASPAGNDRLALSASKNENASSRVLAAGAETPAVRDAVSPAPAALDEEWRLLNARPASLVRNRDLVRWLVRLAQTDHVRAMQLAAAENNLLLRDSLLQAALGGWAQTAPAEAAMWARSLADPSKRVAALETVFSSAAANRPVEIVKLGRDFFREDPAAATSYGCALVDALAAAGHFEAAVSLAGDGAMLDPTQRSILLAKTFSCWATLQPEQAFRAASALTDPVARGDALRCAVGGWGQVDPAGLTRCIAGLPAGPDRIPLMGQALLAWSKIDAAAAMDWVKTNEIGPGADDGVAAMAGAGFLEPREAAAWAHGIENPALRSQTLLTVLRNWANTEPEAARALFEKTSDLQPAHRAEAAALFTSPAL